LVILLAALFVAKTGLAQVDRAVIAVAPVGDSPREAIEAVLPEIREAFGAETVLAPTVAMPVSAYEPARRQTLSTVILDALAAAKRPGWERLLGVADVDLYVPDLNFVFGEADSRRGVAVFSLARLHARDESLFRKRAATEAIHELGHTYGLAHCSDPGCVMWFSNSLSESDRKGTRFCFRHAAELNRARSRPGPGR